jgi:Arc/MetJ-type ribon-helix-helix transcriptional regulator
MNVTLPPQLRQFIAREIKKGRFENESDVMADGLRLLEKRDQIAAGVSSDFGVLGSLAGADIMALAFIVLMEAAESAREDLQEIMAEVKAINNAKAALRKLLSRVNQDIAANADGKPPVKYSARGIGSEKAYHRIPLPRVDPTASGGVRIVPTDLHPSRIEDGCVLCAIRDELKSDLDSMSEMGELESLPLQMAMDRLSKMMSTLSTVLKKISDTDIAIISNLK